MKQTIGVDKTKAIDSAKHELKAIEQELKRNEKEELDVREASKDVSFISELVLVICTLISFILLHGHRPRESGTKLFESTRY
jgi:hypothetical protein